MRAGLTLGRCPRTARKLLQLRLRLGSPILAPRTQATGAETGLLEPEQRWDLREVVDRFGARGNDGVAAH